MHWFFLPLIAAFLWASGNHIDKFLIRRYFSGSSPKAMIMIQVVLELIVLPFLYFLDPGIFSVAPWQILVLLALGAFAVLPIFMYLHALALDEASVVIPLFQTIPVFLYFLSFFFLGEALTADQTLASALIIAGAFFLSIDIVERRFRTKGKVLTLMLTASLCWAVRGVIFKSILVENAFWPVNFWEVAGFTLGGLLILAFSPEFRRQLGVMFANPPRIVALNFINEALSLGASFMLNFAYLFAPITLVAVMASFQPMFVFLIGIFITLFIPRFGKETMLTHHLIQKFIAIAAMIFGSYLLA